MSSPITIVTKSGKIIDLWGIYKIKNNNLFKKFNGSEHTLTTPPGLAVDYKIMTEAQDKGCKYVQLYDRETEFFYTAKIEVFLSKGFRFNRGYGEQIALTLSNWNRSKNSSIPKPLTIEQMTLFEGKNGSNN